jgi:hypothetical protein
VSSRPAGRHRETGLRTIAGMGEGGQDPAHGFFQGDNIWILIPLAALSIPIIAVAGSTPFAWALAVAAVIGATTAAVRYLLVVRHRLALEELEAKQRLAVAERDRYDAINRMVDEPLPRIDQAPPPSPQAHRLRQAGEQPEV